MKSLTKHLILSFLLLFSTLLTAQSVSYRNLTTKDGLPSNTVYQIKQDKEGFIWFATANGLARYDGKNIKLFNPEGIKDKEIIGLFLDKQGRIWFWNLKGKLFFIEKDKISRFQFEDKKTSVKDFCQNNEGNYYFINKGIGIYQINKTWKVSKISDIKKADSFFISKKKLLLKHRDYIYEINDKNIKFLFKFFAPTYGLGLADRAIFNILNNTYWCLNYGTNRLYKVEIEGRFIRNKFPKEILSLENEGFTGIYFDNQQRYWVTTKDNIYVLDKTETKLLNKIKLSGNRVINQIFFDKENNAWLSILGKGVFVNPSSNIKLNSFDEELVTCLTIYKNKLFTGFESGKVVIQDLSTNKSTKLFYNKEAIKKIESDKKGNIWIISAQRATIIDGNNLQIIRKNVGLYRVSYKSIYFDTASSFNYIGTYNGVLKMPINSSDLTNKTDWVVIRLKYAIKGLTVRTYAIEKVNDEYWFGTTDGLYHYQKDSATLTTIPELQNTWITHIINQNDTVWIGTQTNGLFQVIDNKIIQVYNEQNGLISNNCKTLTIDNQTVWIGTNKGINKIDLRTNEIELINNLDGLPSNEINALAIYENKIYIGTSEGLTNFDKTVSTKNTIPPPIYLSNFQIFENDTILSDNYTLDYNENNIRIHFTGVSFRSQGTFTYKYRMLGISDKWIATQVDMASYPILNPGHYTFEAFAINEDGVESEKPIRIQIHIKTPFWETWWFIAFCFLIILAIVGGFFQYRFKQVKEKLELEKTFQRKLSELEMQALQTQMNPHFIFNVLNSIQHYLALNDGEKAMIFLAKFAKLIRVIFEFSQKPTIPLYEEVEFLNLYLAMEKLRFKQGVEITLTVAEDIDEEGVKIPPLLIQPIVENCFKHGLLHKEGVGKVDINFQQTAAGITCVVEDNGIGRAAVQQKKSWNKKHKSAGLNTTKERLKLWLSKEGQTIPKDIFTISDLKDEEEKAIGTRVEMLLSQNQPHEI